MGAIHHVKDLFVFLKHFFELVTLEFRLDGVVNVLNHPSRGRIATHVLGNKLISNVPYHFVLCIIKELLVLELLNDVLEHALFGPAFEIILVAHQQKFEHVLISSIKLFGWYATRSNEAT